MTNKDLIDHCNSKKGNCRNCSYHHSYCEVYMAKYRETPYLENKFHPDRYTDEEIEYEN